MIITKDKIVFLDNPKCGSTTLRSYYETIRHKQIYNNHRNYGGISFKDCKNDYAHIKYLHCNLEGAVTYIRENLKDDPHDYKFFTTIRNPYWRMLSAWVWYKNFEGHFFRMGTPSIKTFEEFLQPGNHYTNFLSKNFRFYEDFKMTEVIKCENLNVNIKSLNKRYKIGFDLKNPFIKKEGRYTHKILFCKESVKLIEKYFKEDFIEGNYKKLDCKALNSIIKKNNLSKNPKK